MKTLVVPYILNAGWRTPC